MPWIDTIGEKEAAGELKEIYAKIAGSRGKVSNIMRIHSLIPESMKAHMELYLAIMFGKSGLKREEREMLAIVVSAANECDYCMNHHAEALDHYWKDMEKVLAFMKDFHDIDLPERTRHMLEYAEKLTRRPWKITEKHILALRSSGFSDENILNMNLIVSYFNFVNRIVMGLGVEFTPGEVRGYNY